MTTHTAPAWLTDSPHARTPGARPITGAASELIVCAELMRLGYYVYRCESPVAPFDLVAYKGGQCIRVEVKTVTPHPTAPDFSRPKNDQWDLLAVVADATVFFFEPTTPVLDMRNAFRDYYGLPPSELVELQPCPSAAAYHRHRRKEEVCDPCDGFMRQHNHERYKLRKARVAQSPEGRQ